VMTMTLSQIGLNRKSALEIRDSKFRDPEVEEFRMNLYEAKTPLLGKGGVAAPSRNIPVPLKGADGEAVKKLESSAIPLLASLLRWCKEGNNALSQLIHTFGVVRSNSK